MSSLLSGNKIDKPIATSKSLDVREAFFKMKSSITYPISCGKSHCKINEDYDEED